MTGGYAQDFNRGGRFFDSNRMDWRGLGARSRRVSFRHPGLWLCEALIPPAPVPATPQEFCKALPSIAGLEAVRLRTGASPHPVSLSGADFPEIAENRKRSALQQARSLAEPVLLRSADPFPQPRFGGQSPAEVTGQESPEEDPAPSPALSSTRSLVSLRQGRPAPPDGDNPTIPVALRRSGVIRQSTGCSCPRKEDD
jgi:hypothetical protein